MSSIVDDVQSIAGKLKQKKASNWEVSKSWMTKGYTVLNGVDYPGRCWQITEDQVEDFKNGILQQVIRACIEKG